ncbi:MAG TPA: IS1595 family transposase [Pseudolabrys sp.]|nr:IS1595 family transposase [Pseudolabrys sp.]
MPANLQNPIFTDETKAREALEAMRWPDGPVCPHCGSVEGITKAQGKSARPGLYYCAPCNDQFTATVGTVMERSKIPLTKWWLAMHLLGTSKKGMSAHQLHRMLGITYKSAWFMCHRIREAMRDDSVPGFDPLGGKGKVVEADETYFGPVEERKPSKQRKGRPYTKGGRSGPGGKRAIVALVERGGRVRSFHPATADGESVTAIVLENIKRESRLHTDESRLYMSPGAQFAAHETVTHSHKEYVRGDVHTNTIEGVFSIFKRGMKGVYQHCDEKHLHRYLAEFDFRYNNRTALGVDDVERVAKIAKGIAGKRLTYRLPH